MRGGGGGEEHSYSHTVRGITHTHMCCCQVAACAVAWMLAMHQQLVWSTQGHTPPCHHPHHHHRVDACLAVCPLPLLLRRVLPQREERRGEAVRSRCRDWCGGGVAGCEQHVACWHQQTTQHSKGKGGGRGGAATRTACERDTPSSPLSHQPGVVGKRPVVWLCETRIPFPLHQHTHLVMKQQRSG